MMPAEHVLRSFDGLELFVRRYVPEQAPSDERTLVIVHGASEYGVRYDHVARLFAAAGWTVLAGDSRGHGRSGGIPMHVHRFDDYLRDLDTLWQYFELRPQRTAVLAHSFGSLISARFAQLRSDKLSALVMMSPLLRLKVHINPFVIALGKLISFAHPTFRFKSRVNPQDTTRDPTRLLARDDDNMIHRSVTCGWFFEMKSALQAVWRDVAAVRLPLLILQGGADRIVDPELVRPWLDRVASSDKELLWFSDHYHELHNEPDWQPILSQVADWLDRRLPQSAVVERLAVR